MAHKHIGRLVKKIVMCRIGERQWSGDASYHGVDGEISLFAIQKVIYLQGFDIIMVLPYAVCGKGRASAVEWFSFSNINVATPTVEGKTTYKNQRPNYCLRVPPMKANAEAEVMAHIWHSGKTESYSECNTYKYATPYPV